MAFPLVVIGQKIKASWGNLVAERFNAARAWLLFTPVADIDASTGGAAQWLTLGNVTVPTWATSAIVTWTITGVFDVTAAPNEYDLVGRIGLDAGHVARFRGETAVGGRFQLCWETRITFTAWGAKSVNITAARLVGAGLWRVNTIADVTAAIHFLDT